MARRRPVADTHRRFAWARIWRTCPYLAGDEKWAGDFRAKGFRMIAYGVDTLLMQRALADGIKLLQGTLKK